MAHISQMQITYLQVRSYGEHDERQEKSDMKHAIDAVSHPRIYHNLHHDVSYERFTSTPVLISKRLTCEEEKEVGEARTS